MYINRTEGSSRTPSRPTRKKSSKNADETFSRALDEVLNVDAVELDLEKESRRKPKRQDQEETEEKPSTDGGLDVTV